MLRESGASGAHSMSVDTGSSACCSGTWLTRHHCMESAAREAFHAMVRGVIMGELREFVRLAMQEGVNRREVANQRCDERVPFRLVAVSVCFYQERHCGARRLQEGRYDLFFRF